MSVRVGKFSMGYARILLKSYWCEVMLLVLFLAGNDHIAKGRFGETWWWQTICWTVVALAFFKWVYKITKMTPRHRWKLLSQTFVAMGSGVFVGFIVICVMYTIKGRSIDFEESRWLIWFLLAGLLGFIFGALAFWRTRRLDQSLRDYLRHRSLRRRRSKFM